MANISAVSVTVVPCNRSFYVGDAVTEEDIKANFENGTLKMTIPKKEAKAVPEKKFISIEG